jgi:hypothetical protein
MCGCPYRAIDQLRNPFSDITRLRKHPRSDMRNLDGTRRSTRGGANEKEGRGIGRTEPGRRCLTRVGMGIVLWLGPPHDDNDLLCHGSWACLVC